MFLWREEISGWTGEHCGDGEVRSPFDGSQEELMDVECLHLLYSHDFSFVFVPRDQRLGVTAVPAHRTR